MKSAFDIGKADSHSLDTLFFFEILQIVISELIFWGAAKMIKRLNLKPELEAEVLGGGARELYGLR